MSCYQVNILLRDVHRSAALAQCFQTEPDKVLGQYARVLSGASPTCL
jgi:hypothetical protein